MYLRDSHYCSEDHGRSSGWIPFRGLEWMQTGVAAVLSFGTTILSSPSVSLPASSTWPGSFPHWAGSTDGNLWIFSNLAGTRFPDFMGQDIFSHMFLSLSYFFHSFSYNWKLWYLQKKWWIFQQTQNFILPSLDQYSYPALILEMILYWRYPREKLIFTEQ